MTANASGRSSTQIKVHHYRQILLLPVLLEFNREGESDEHSALTPLWSEWRSVLRRGGWEECKFLPQTEVRPGPYSDFAECEPTYEEVVYFHAFARDWLYGDGSQDPHERPMIRFRRGDISEMRVRLDADDLHRKEGDAESSHNSVEFAFDVPRVELYLCKPGIAILAVEVVWKQSPDVTALCLADVLMLQSRIRELYPPYFTGEGHFVPGQCPQKVAWLGPKKTGELDVLVASDFHCGRRHFAEQVAIGAEPPVSAHWMYLLEPIKPYRKRDEEDPRFRQIIDDRLPGLTYVSVDDPRLISEGDFDRLTFCETGGDAPYPYSAEFLKQGRDACKYDRYWRQRPDHDSERDDGLKLNTRYLCSGFQFVAIGSESSEFFTKVLRDHVRRHYFRLGLIAHFQRAALLKFTDEMSDAIKKLKGQSPHQELSNPAFRKRIEDLQMTFLKFVSRAWFSEVSNQLQGQEMFRWWSGLLRNQRLFEEVNEMNRTMHAVITEHDGRQVSRRNLLVTMVALLISAVALIVSLVTI